MFGSLCFLSRLYKAIGSKEQGGTTARRGPNMGSAPPFSHTVHVGCVHSLFSFLCAPIIRDSGPAPVQNENYVIRFVMLFS